MMKLRYEHLIGIEYKHGSNDCYGLIRRFYKDNFDLNLRNYARPHDWWNTDLYRGSTAKQTHDCNTVKEAMAAPLV